MTTSDAQNAPARDDAQSPASTPTTLSRLLGGWTRAQGARRPDARPAAHVGDDGAQPAGAEPIGAVEPAGAGPVGVAEPEGARPADAGPAVAGPGGAGPVPGPMSAPEAAAEDIEDDEDEDDVEEHVFATADPRDFTDDAGPQYEDEDFDEAQAPDAALDARVGRIPAPAPVPSPAPAPSAAPAPGASGSLAAPASAAPAPEGRRARHDGDAPDAPDDPDSSDAPEAGLAPLDSFTDRFTDRELTWMDFNERVLEQAESRGVGGEVLAYVW